jgi:malonyl-CoA decarboxylase
MAPLRRALGAGLGQAARLLRGRGSPQLTERDQRKLRTLLDECLRPDVGGVIARARAAEIAELYSALDQQGRLRFFEALADGYGCDERAVATAVDRFRAATASDAREAARRELRKVLTPRWERLFEALCGLGGGVKFTVDLRHDLLGLRSSSPALAGLDADLRTVLSRAFPPGLLELRRLTWDDPASLLEKLIAYEAVHEITSWQDLRNRLDADRRCYAFLHPGMPAEPLIFVEVALVRGMAGHIAPLLDVGAPLGASEEADTAIFYSISACQPGLAGVNLGDVLIKEVVADLSRELPRLERFATLSPIPGFRAWFERRLAAHSGAGEPLLTEAEIAGLEAVTADHAGDEAALLAVLASEPWWERPALAEAVRAPLTRLCATYLLTPDEAGRSPDRVANFHLTNGARVERLNWLANLSPGGLRESFGLMVNNRYELDRIDANHVAYVTQGRIARAGAVAKLLGG